MKIRLNENNVSLSPKKLMCEKLNVRFRSHSYQKKVQNLKSILNLIKNDSVLGQKRNRWHKILSKDIYIDEALHVLNDLLDSNVQ